MTVTVTYPTERKLQEFKNLQNGWHYGEGVSFQQAIIDNTISLHQEAIRLTLFETNAFPGLNGEIMLAIYSGVHYLEFTLEPDDSVTFYREKDNEEICYQEELSLDKAKVKIEQFKKEQEEITE